MFLRIRRPEPGKGENHAVSVWTRFCSRCTGRAPFLGQRWRKGRKYERNSAIRSLCLVNPADASALLQGLRCFERDLRQCSERSHPRIRVRFAAGLTVLSLLAWRRSRFSAPADEPLEAPDLASLERLTRYITRAPIHLDASRTRGAGRFGARRPPVNERREQDREPSPGHSRNDGA